MSSHALFTLLLLIGFSRSEKINPSLLDFTIVSTTTSPQPDNNQLKTFDDSVPKNCKEVQKTGYNISGIYFVQPKSAPEPFLVLCDMHTRGGGWATILNRFNGTQNFYLPFSDYERGFGGLRNEFWLGLDKIHYLTGHQINQLLVELVDWDSQKVFGLYDSFVVGGKSDDYVVKVLEGYSGTAGNSLVNEVDMKFSTGDNDNDLWSGGNCASFFQAGWWYRSCKNAHPTGKYLGRNFSEEDAYHGMNWKTFRGEKYSLKEIRMMVRPRT